MSDIWAHRVLREQGVDSIEVPRRDAEISVMVESIELAHHGPETNYRPYLSLVGEVRAVAPVEPFPESVGSVTFPAGSGERVYAFYEFNDKQLVALAGKGYFTEAFVVPEAITGIEWQLPAQVEALVLPAVAEDPESVPVVFVKVHDLGDLRIDEASSGYDLIEYFENTGVDRLESIGTTAEIGTRFRSGEINSLFDENELGAPEPESLVLDSDAVTNEVSETADFASRIQSVEAALDNEEQQLDADLARIEGTPQNVYWDKVASALDSESGSVMPSVLQESETAENSGDSDLDLEFEDLDDAVVSDTAAEAAREAFEATKRRVEQRAAGVEQDLDDEAGQEY